MSPTSSAHGARSQTSSSANSQLQTSNQALRSQTDGADEPDDIPIEALVQHLLAAKRSLNSISLVWRANELVTSARTSLEQSLILSSRTTFLRRGITDQVKLLRRVRSGVGHVYKEGLREFEDVIRSLDEADIRLQQTMDVLRETMVERKFRPEGEEERSLLDFVDEQGVEGIRRGLREGIDQSQEAQATLLTTLTTFDTDLQTLKSLLSSSSLRQSAISPNSSHQDATLPPPGHPSLMPTILSNLESRAEDMACLLDSLVRHFDLCVQATKHTEGGYAAVHKFASTNPLPEGVTVSGVMATHAQDVEKEGGEEEEEEPPSEEERRQLLLTVASDASEVDSVVSDLHTSLTSMETLSSLVASHIALLAENHASAVQAFTYLSSHLQPSLPLYLLASHTFSARWTSDLLPLLLERMDELEGMTSFYDGYLRAYSSLQDEVKRREQAEEKMRSVVRKAMDEVQKLGHREERERRRVRAQVGDWIPGDLWRGLGDGAVRFEVREVRPGDEQESLRAGDGGEDSIEAGHGGRAAEEGIGLGLGLGLGLMTGQRP